jgi:hypothetical protein
MPETSAASILAQQITECYSRLPQVEAVVLAGSQGAANADIRSDIDLYVYYSSEIPPDERIKIATQNAARSEPLNAFWESGDEWIDAATGVQVDVTIRHMRWIEEQLERVLKKYQASTGYSTCFWHNVLHSQALFDRNGWYAALQVNANQPYPQQLQAAIIAKNHPILRASLSSYTHQLESAIARSDLVSINHRTAALLASYFDILFAINKLPHPGEKRLVDFALTRCDKLPMNMAEQINALIAALPQADQQIIERVHNLLDGLDSVLRDEKLI